MPGLFDDLVPTTAQPRAGRFDDLVPQAPKSGFVEGVKQTGRELVESGRRLGQYTRGLGLAFNIGEAQNLDELIARAEAAGDQEGAAALRAERETRLANAGEVAANIARSDQESTFKSRPVVQEIGQAQDIGGVVSAFRKDPIGAVVGFTAESAAQMAPALVAGLLAGPAAGVAVMGATSAASELGSTILDYAQEKGVNTKDAAALTAFYSNPANLEAATNKGGTRGAIIGALDALTGGIASKTLAPAAVKGALKRQAINIPAQMGVQMAGGGGGEALGQLATEGKITSVGAIAGEVLGELGGAPAEVAAFSKDVRTAMAARRKPLQEEIKDVLDSPDIDSAVQAADALSRANQEVDEATAEYLAEPTAPAMPGPARPTAASIDRQAELTQQSIVAGTEFERQSAAAQAQAARGEPTPGPAAEFVDLTPMNPLQARQRLTVLRDEVAQQGGNALELQIASHPAQPGALAIRRVPLPDLNLGTNVPAVGTAEAQNRIESAALAGEVSRRRNTPDEQGRQALITRTMQAIEARGGVASPEEARVLRESNMGQPYNRIDPSLSTPLREEEALTQATGLAVGRAPRETIATPTPAPDVQGERLAAQERANEQSMTAFASGAPGREQARAVGEKALQEAANRAPAPPAAAQVIEALRVAPALRAAEQKARVDQARSRYTAAEMTALELAANAPATMTAEQKLVVQRLTAAQPKASPARDALTAQGLREVTVQELPRSSKSVRDGAVQLEGITRETHGLVTRMAKLYGKRVVVYEGGDGRDGFFDPKDPDTVYLNRASSKPHLVVFGHELLHSLKQSSPETYQRLEATIRGQLKEGAEQTFAEDYGAQADTEELVADLIGNRMAEESFWLEVFQGMDAPAANRLALAVASAVQKAKQVVSRMTGFKTDELVKDLDAVKNAAVAAMRQYAKQQRPAAQRLAKEEGAPDATGQVDEQAGVRQERQDRDGARQAAEAGGRDRVLGEARRGQEGPPAAQRQGVEQPRATDGTFKSWNEADELAAAEAQQKFSPRRDKTGGELDYTVREEKLGVNKDERAVFVEARDPRTGERRGLVDFAVRADGTLVAENAKVAPEFKGRGIAEQMYRAVREAGYDIAPGRVQTDAGQRMVEGLQRKGVINKEAEGARFRAGDLDLVPIEGETIPGVKFSPARGQLYLMSRRSAATISAADRMRATQNNASGESAASLESQRRLREEAARDRPRVLVERDGTVRPLTGVNAVDQRARAGQVILQKNIGKDTWTVLEQGPDVTPGMVARAIYNAGRVKASTRRAFPETPGFKAWAGDAELVAADETTGFRAGRSYVVEAYHGAAVDITQFDPEKAQPESDLGAGFYLTTSIRDANANYAGEGPDRQRTIETRAERYEADNPDSNDLSYMDARARARAELMQNEGVVYRVYVRLRNPVVIGESRPGSTESFFDYNEEYDEETDTYGDPTGGLVPVLKALEDIGPDAYIDFDGGQAAGLLLEKAVDNAGLTGQQLVEALKEAAVYASDPDTGDLLSGEVIRRVMEDAGYDGFIDQTVSRFKMVGVDKNTAHIVVFHPEQIKSATGNSGAFDAANPDIRASARRPSYGEAQENSTSVVGVHYSQQPRQQLDSAFAGTGLKGADITRIEADKGEKKRIYFYVDKGQGILPESGVGGYAHEVQLNNLYDAEADPLFLAEDNPNPTQFERAVTRAGFDGYYRDSFRTDVGAAVLLGQHTVPVAQVGQGRRAPSGEKPARAKAPERTGWRKTLADLRASKRLPSGAIEGERWPGMIKRLEPALYEGMLPSGVFQAILDRGPMYKDEVASEYRVRARPREKAGPAADLDEKQQQLYIGQYLDSFELRGEEPFARNRDLGAFLERLALKVHGQPLTENTPENREFIAKVLAAETKRALARDGHAGQWYKTTLAEALKTAEELHPELATDQDARFVFTFALAITSNGQTIADNTRMAFESYEAWKKRGVLPSRVEGGGDRAGTMVRAFQYFNGMIRNPGGIAATRYALLRKWTAKELRDSSGKNLSSALADEEVYGGVLFGPKIGGAFLQNLNGNFDALTIDRWLMRTWGRLTGRLTDSNSKTGLRDAPTSAGERRYIRETLEQALEQVRASGEQIDMADLQASLWYPEKELYNTLARPDTRADPTDYAQEFKAYVQAQRTQGRPARGEGPRAGRDAERRPRPVVSPQQGLFASPNRPERDARSGTPLLNIGLDTRGGDRPVTSLDVRRALDDVGARVVGTWQYQSDTEPTMVVQLAEPLPPAAVDRLSAALRQEAIAQFDGEQGGLYGPQAEQWGDFNPEFFIMPDGRRMSATSEVDVVELRKQASVLRSLRKCLLA